MHCTCIFYNLNLYFLLFEYKYEIFTCIAYKHFNHNWVALCRSGHTSSTLACMARLYIPASASPAWASSLRLWRPDTASCHAEAGTLSSSPITSPGHGIMNVNNNAMQWRCNYIMDLKMTYGDGEPAPLLGVVVRCVRPEPLHQGGGDVGRLGEWLQRDVPQGVREHQAAHVYPDVLIHLV